MRAINEFRRILRTTRTWKTWSKYVSSHKGFSSLVHAGFSPFLFSIISLLILYSYTKIQSTHADYQSGWGVLALNTDKSLYKPGETAEISIAVLDTKGGMVCDADLKLGIKTPSGQKHVLSTENGAITINESCTKKGFTPNPDIQTKYLLEEMGKYTVTLIAKTNNGVYVIHDEITTTQIIDFDIKRVSPTRIYPLEPYEFSFLITPSGDHKGYFEEIIPYNFAVLDTSLSKVVKSGKNSETNLVQSTHITPMENDFEVIRHENGQVIRWDVDWQANEKYLLTYTLDMPDISPDFYSIGPATLKTKAGHEVFTETRLWQLAIDLINLEQKDNGVVKGTTVTATFSTGATADNLIVAICGTDQNRTLTGPSGFSTAINQSGTPSQAIFYDLAGGGETNISCTISGKSVRAGIHIYEYSDIDTTTPYDTSNSATGNGTSVSTGSVTPTNANTVLVAGVISTGEGSYSSWSNSFVEQHDFQNTSNPSAARNSYAGADRIVFSSTSYSTSATGPGGDWRGQIAVFNAAAASEPAFVQNDYEWFVDQSSVTLTNNWPAGTGEDIAENAALTQLPATNEPLTSGDQIRIQMNVSVSATIMDAGYSGLLLQYVEASDCTTASGWSNVGGKSSGSIWRLFDNTGIGDSTPQVNQISTSDSTAEGLYSETNPTAPNPNEVLAGEDTEWDWPVENNGASANSTYCFRMILEDTTPFASYNADGYPKLTTAPESGNMLRHGKFFTGDSEQGFFWAN